MARAWYIDDSQKDLKEELHFNPPRFVDAKQLQELTGLEYYRVDVDHLQDDQQFVDLRKNRGYNWDDTIEVSRALLPNYDAMLVKFATEHLHENEEIRLFMEGSGYFDVRDKNDRWIRLAVDSGDLLVLPARIYHRFVLTEEKFIKIMRLYCGTPVWSSINREDNIASHAKEIPISA